MDEIWYLCPDCGATFSKIYIFRDGKEHIKCPHCGGTAHRNRMKEIIDEIKSRPGI